MPPASKIASVPIERGETDPDADDETGSILQLRPATIPIDIGEPSAFELPVAAPEEKPPVIRTPQRVKSHHESRLRGVSHKRHAKARRQTGSVCAVRSFQGDLRRPEIHAAANGRRQDSVALASRGPDTPSRLDH